MLKLKTKEVMHEVGIIQNVLERIEEIAVQNHVKKITRIHLVIGKLRAVMPQALEMGFQALPKNEIFAGCALTYEERVAVARCENCSKEYECKFPNDPCPDCGPGKNSILQGRELYIDYFECQE